MNAVHPAFNATLNAICPPPKKKRPDPPPCPDAYYEYVHQTDIGEVVCWIEYTRAERQTYWEPGCPSSAEVIEVWLGDINISNGVEEFAISEIKEKSLIEIEESLDDNSDDF